MDLQIVEKGSEINLDIASKDEGVNHPFYFGAGWDTDDGSAVDLDIVAALLNADGKMASAEDLIYFGRRTAPGVQLSEDNTTGEGDGDDENIVFTTANIADSVTSIVVGLACYSNTDFSHAPNPHFRAVDGTLEADPQIADAPMGNGEAEDTLLVAFRLNRTDAGWVMTNVGEYHKVGNGSAAIEGFGNLYK